MVCYYGSWAVNRPGAGKFDVEDIDPFVCTHVIYGWVVVLFFNSFTNTPLEIILFYEFTYTLAARVLSRMIYFR